MGAFRIATYNVNSIRSRLHIILPWLERRRPDVFCMQETKVDNGRFPRTAFEDAGYHVLFEGDKRYNGVAIASLAAPENVVSGFDDGGPPDRDRLLAATYAGIPVINTYVPQGRDRDLPQFAYKLAWFDRFRTFLQRAYKPEAPVLWCGDLNVAPEPLDVHDPKRLLGHVCFTPEAWEALGRVTAWGLRDAFRLLHPGEAGQYTFFDYRVPNALQRRLGWRIDHILVTAPLADRLQSCTIDIEPRRMDKPSDHTILLAEFHL